MHLYASMPRIGAAGGRRCRLMLSGGDHNAAKSGLPPACQAGMMRLDYAYYYMLVGWRAALLPGQADDIARQFLYISIRHLHHRTGRDFCWYMIGPRRQSPTQALPRGFMRGWAHYLFLMMICALASIIRMTKPLSHRPIPPPTTAPR